MRQNRVFLVYFSITATAHTQARHARQSTTLRSNGCLRCPLLPTTAHGAGPLTTAEGELCVLGHRICLIQNHELDTLAEQLLRAGKALDLVAHDVNAAVI